MIYKYYISVEKEKLTVREAARRAQPLGGADAQALEGALQQVERELKLLQKAIRNWIPYMDTCSACDDEICKRERAIIEALAETH